MWFFAVYVLVFARAGGVIAPPFFYAAKRHSTLLCWRYFARTLLIYFFPLTFCAKKHMLYLQRNTVFAPAVRITLIAILRANPHAFYSKDFCVAAPHVKN